jgi:hypothetical protein
MLTGSSGSGRITVQPETMLSWQAKAKSLIEQKENLCRAPSIRDGERHVFIKTPGQDMLHFCGFGQLMLHFLSSWCSALFRRKNLYWPSYASIGPNYDSNDKEEEEEEEEEEWKNKAYSNLIHAGGVGEDSNLLKTPFCETYDR